jgi:hypothetical protein
MELDLGWLGGIDAFGELVQFPRKPVRLGLEYGDSCENKIPLVYIRDRTRVIKIEEMHRKNAAEWTFVQRTASAALSTAE